MGSLISVAEFRNALREKRKPDGGVYRLSTIPSVAVEGTSRARRFCFSDGSVDRMGDTIDPNGWDLSDFLQNPVALWAHDSTQPTIGKASNVGVESARLMGDIEFAPFETYAFADTIYRLYEGGFLNAVSVGFLPIEYSYVEDDPDRGWGIDFKRQQLLEISACPIPANPNALGAARAKGIDSRPLAIWAEKLLDGFGKSVLSKSQLVALRRQAQEPRSMSKQRPRLRADEPMSETDPSAGGATVGNCGRPADKECGLKDQSECAIHGMGGVGVGDPADGGDKNIRSAVRAVVRMEMRRLRRPGAKRVRRRDVADGDGGNELPEGHEDAIQRACVHFRSAEDYYDSADAHHDEAMNLMDEAAKDLEGDDPPPDDHADTVRMASVKFKSAEALYDLGDQDHDKAMGLLDNAVKALDADASDPDTDIETAPNDDPAIKAALAKVQAHRARA